MSNIHVFNIKDTTIEVDHRVVEVDTTDYTASDLIAKMYFADDVDFQQQVTTIYKNDILSKEWCIKKFKDLGYIYHPPLTNNIYISLGCREDFSLARYLKVLNKFAKLINNQVVSSVVWQNFSLFASYPDQAKKVFGNQDQMYKLVLFYFMSEFYYFDLFKLKKSELFFNRLILEDSSYSLQRFDQVAKQVDSLLDGLFLVQDLGNAPANFMNPAKLAEHATNLTAIDNVTVKVLNKSEIIAEQMNAFLAVAQGSVQEPKFIEMKYQGADSSIAPIVLIGKGITFDTGGISLKPGQRMDDMKFDMCGAATVVGVLNTVAKMELPINLIVLVPTCENMPSGTAIKPGDIIKSRSGKTVEILHTDAEGRLILCDALDYAKQFKPKLVIDVATLTGACVVALGKVFAGLYSNQDDIANQLLDIGNKTGDRAWHLPLSEEYGETLKSKYADIANIAITWDGYGGSAKAAWFLYEFTYDPINKKHYDWVHLDIAGISQFSSGMATGRPFMLLVEFLLNYDKRA